MSKLLRVLLFAAVAFSFTGKLSKADDDGIYEVSSVLTNLPSLMKGKLTPVSSFTTEDVIFFMNTCSWKDIREGAGSHWVQWNWYRKGTLVSTSTKRVKFMHAPFHLVTRHLANDFGPGPIQIQVLLDSKVLASASFRISS